MSNPTKDYVDNFRANLPSGVSYNSDVSDYVYNNKRFNSEWEVERYRQYLAKFGTFTNYVANTFNPELVFDFDEEVYGVNNYFSSFSDAITHTRAGNATMVDSTGTLVWAPHNLLTYSTPDAEEPTDWGGISGGSRSLTTLSNGLTGISFTSSGDRPGLSQTKSFSTSTTYTLTVYVENLNITSGNEDIVTWFDGDTFDSYNLFELEDLGGNWYSATFTTSASATSGYIRYGLGVASSVIGTGDFGGIHLYRSDLGGMASVPVQDRVADSSTYVPTTSSAKYLPRREAYAYVGGELTGPYLQVESESRTNLVTYSGDFTDESWGVDATLTENASVSPSGETDATLLTSTSAIQRARVDVSVTGGEYYTDSIYIKNKDATTTRVLFREDGAGDAFDNFDWSDGVPTRDSVSGLVEFEAVGSGWYRFHASKVVDATTTLQSIEVQPDRAAAGGVYIWGAQIEEGSTPSSYIPTNGSTVTRPAETLTVPSDKLPWGDAVSIAMKGLVTYADEDTFATVRTIEWDAGGGNRILHNIDTNGSDVGQFTFYQQESGTNTSVGSASSYLTPGVNKPFSVASRHGSTFINGAVDGTALTADTTPTALPDLSSTDIDIASDFMGYIEIIRIWADDIGDDGTEEASQ